MTLSVIIISFNTRELTLRCLATLMPELAGIDAEVWAVDNASTDGSADAIAAAFPHVHLMRNESNLGFGAANNLAMRPCMGQNLLLLNSDAFPQPGAIAHLLNYLAAHPEAGVVGPRLLNADRSLQISCYRFPSPARAWLENLWVSALLPSHPRVGDYRAWPHDRERNVDWIVGACMLVRRQVFQQVGGFDERFFMYAEESDWQKRIRDAGWQVAFTPGAQVLHLGGASGASEPARINRHFFESLDYYQLKHHGVPGLIALRMAMVIGCVVRGVLWALTLVARPARRGLARRKVRLHAWLTWRQLTRWHVTRSAWGSA